MVVDSVCSSQCEFDPIACLRKLDNILAATRSKLLMFIEDLDRNSSEAFLNDQLPALLDRIRQLKNVYFVFAIGSEKESAQILMRITQHLESLDSIKRTHTKEIVMAFRNSCMDKYPDDIDPVDAKDRDSRLRLISKPIVDTYSIEGFLSGEYPGTHDYVADALSNPRVLKQVLRRVDRAWSALHGEIDFDDLFITHLLRYVYKEAYAFLLNNLHSFRSMNDRENDDDGAKRKRAELAKDLESALKLSDIEIVDNLIQSLFPTWKKDRWATNHQAPQGVRHSVPVDYWTRLQHEQIDPSDIRDQTILKSIKRWQMNHATVIVDHKSLAHFIVESREASAKVYHFSRLLSEKDIHILASQANTLILDQHGKNASHESNHAFRDLWHASLDRIWQGREKWLVDEIERALPISIQLANDLYYFWRNKTYSDVKFHPDTTELRQAIVQVAKDLWVNHANRMTSALSPNHPESLYMFVIEFSKADMVGNGFKYAEWKWVFDMMVNALEESPDIMAQQFIQFMVYQPDSLDKKFKVRIQSSQRMFGERLPDVIHLLNQHLVPDNYQGSDKKQASLLKYFCQEWITAQAQGGKALDELKMKYEGSTQPDDKSGENGEQASNGAHGVASRHCTLPVK
jgi:hypothetical protein